MKKILLGLVAVLVFVAFILPALLPAKAKVSRSLEINATPEVVHAFLADLNQFPIWNPFMELGPNTKFQIEGSGLGASYSWQGEKTGDGKMTVTEIVPPKLVKVEMRFYKPMPGEAVSYWTTDPTATGGTRVVWSFEQELTYFKRLFGLMMDQTMGGVFENGLSKLKSQLESRKS